MINYISLLKIRPYFALIQIQFKFNTKLRLINVNTFKFNLYFSQSLRAIQFKSSIKNKLQLNLLMGKVK